MTNHFIHLHYKSLQGFTIIELMIVVAVIGILAAIAYPNYQSYIKRTKRADMMVEMQNIGSSLEAAKLAKGSYGAVTTSAYTGDYPRGGNAVYSVAITPNPLTKNWTITATPSTGNILNGDGNLTLNSKGVKCWKTKCGIDDQWKN